MASTSGPLFGGSASRGNSKNLVEFRAGKMNLRGNTVHPDTRKGMVYVHQGDDSLMHFCWKDRTTGKVEEDLIIFPDDVMYKPVAACTTGRVFLLKFKSNSKKFFYWMQEPKTEKDEEYCTKINEVLNNPPSPWSGGNSASSSGGGGGGGGSGGIPANLQEADLHTLLNNVNQQQLMQMLQNTGGLANLLGGGSGGSSSARESLNSAVAAAASPSTTAASSTTSSSSKTTTTKPATTSSSSKPTTSAPKTSTSSSSAAAKPASTAAAAAATPAFQISDLQSILSGLNVPQQQDEKVTVDLSSAVTADSPALQSILKNKDFVSKLVEFLPSIGETVPAAESVRDNVASPQFNQAMSMFSTLLESGQLGPLVQQFDMGAEAVTAAEAGNMEDFVKALQNKDKESKDKDGKDEGEDGMALD